jgi:hypothetical protein
MTEFAFSAWTGDEGLAAEPDAGFESACDREVRVAEGDAALMVGALQGDTRLISGRVDSELV